MKKITFLFVLILLQPLSAAPNSADSLQAPTSASQLIEALDFKDADLRDVVRAIAAKYQLNLFIENEIQKKISIHLTKIPVYEALRFITKRYGLVLEQEGNVFNIKEPVVEQPPPLPIEIYYKNGLLSVSLNNEPIQNVVKELTQKSGINIVTETGVSGIINGFLQDIPFKDGLQTLMQINGFKAVEKNNVYFIAKENPATNETNGRGYVSGSNRLDIRVQNELISLSANSEPVKNVLTPYR